jgi:aldehyde dehydrogenase (NAD+)
VVIGDGEAGGALVDDPRVTVISATGSTRMGRAVAQRAAARLARTILELGGNNALIAAPSADLDLAVRAIVFSAVGTAGQRCTSMRRLIVHESIADALLARLLAAYGSLPIGDPRAEGTLVGPLIDERAFEAMQRALAAARSEGGPVHGGERVSVTGCEGGFYVRPALAEMPAQSALVREETFAPLLYVLRYSRFEDAIALNNGVPQGLSSSLFSNDLREAETFVSGHRQRLRDRQRQHRAVGRRDRRGVRRREGHRRRAGVGVRRMEGLHAAGHQHRQLQPRAAARTGHSLRRR